MKDDHYIPALRYRWLTRFYDPVVALTSREKVFRHKLLARITPIRANHVLDLACGTGTMARMIKKASPATTVHGLDGDPGILELAHKKSLQQGQDIRFDHGMSFAMPYADNSFDIVVCALFFHHLNTINKQQTLAEVQRILKAGGWFFVCDWGKPANPLLRLSFYLVQLLDGFAVTQENAQGRLPGIITAAGFTRVVVADRISTPLGTLDLITAFSPPGRPCAIN